MGLWTNDYKVCKADVILEQLEERIVLDGAVEASAGAWDGPDPGNGIWDGATHVIDGTAFIFLDAPGNGAGDGVGYWWNNDIGAWGWALDYKSGWWWENTVADGWDWMNVGWWDFEWYANQGICVFDGQTRTDWYGVEMEYDQAGEEMVYQVDGADYMKYEMDRTGDSAWGWFWWDAGTGQGVWTEWVDGSDNSYALKTNSYSGFSSEMLYDNYWRPLPGGHGQDWVFFDYSGTFGEGGTYYFWLDSGSDFTLDYTSNATATPAVWGTSATGMTADWQYIGSSLFSFQTGANWSIYDGSYGVDDEWFQYDAQGFTNAEFGNWDFDSTQNGFNLAFLSGKDNNATSADPYSDNFDKLIDNCIYILGDDGAITDPVPWDYDSHTFGQIVDVVGAISLSQGYQFLNAVMFHGQGWTDATGIEIGSTLFDAVADVTGQAANFNELAGYLNGNGLGAEVQIMNSDAAASTTGTDILTAMQTALSGNGPWGVSTTLWASDDLSGDWSGVADAEPNWFLEWDGSGGTDPLDLAKLLYETDYTGSGDTGLVGDVTTT